MKDTHVDVAWVWALLLTIWAPYFFSFMSAMFQLCFKRCPKLEIVPLVVVS